MTHVVNGNCRFCRYTECVETCPVACFHVNETRVYINPDVCIDCGACIPACPVEAIMEDFEVPDDEVHWLDINAKAAARYPVLDRKLDSLPGAEARRVELGY